MADPNNRRVERTPVTLKIKFKSETIDQFIERYAVDVSPGGIFVRTKEPLAVGTPMKFEFQLRDASPLIAGEGTVVWTRENDPSRPTVAPGMGVRFDRLAEGSQGVIDRILAEKAKQPQRANSDTAKPFMDMPTRVAPLPMQDALRATPSAKPFMDMPTRVAPLPSQDALLGGETPTTPLSRSPGRATPFRNDVGTYAKEAFEEATKVRSLDDLVAATAEVAALGRASPPPSGAASVSPAVSVGGEVETASDLDSTPGLPSPPVLDPFGQAADDPMLSRRRPSTAPPQPRRTTMPPRPPTAPPHARRPSTAPPHARRSTTAPPPMPISSDFNRASGEPDLPMAAGIISPRTHLGVEPATPVFSRDPMNRFGSSSSELAAEQSASSPQKRASRTPTLVAILVIAAAAVAVWYFVLRNDSPNVASTSQQTSVFGAATSSGADVAPKPSVTEPPKPITVETEIASTAPKSKVSVVDSDQTGLAPLTAKLEKDKTYTVRIEAPGYLKAELEVVGGQDRVTAKPVAKPHILIVSSEPSGAQILINNSPTGKVTPAEIELTASYTAKPRLHLQLHKAGFRWVDRIVETTGHLTEEDARMTLGVDVPLSPAASDTGASKANAGTEHRAGSAAEPSDSGGERTPEPAPAPPPSSDQPEPPKS